MISISNLKEAVSIAGRLNPKFRQLAMEPIDTEDPNVVKINPGTQLCDIEFHYMAGVAQCRVRLASPQDIETFLYKADSSLLSTMGNHKTCGNEIIVSKESSNLLADAGWLVGCALKFREQIEKLSDFLSVIDDDHKKLLVVIIPKEGESIELMMATDKLPENHQEGQHIIGRHRYSMSGEGFRAESKLLYLLTAKPLIKVYAGKYLIYCETPELNVSEDEALSLEKEITISPLPATVVAERRTLYEGEFKYELFIGRDEDFDISKLKFYENNTSEFDPDCYDGFSLHKIKYGNTILPLVNRNNYGTWQARYFFGTLYSDYIEYQ